MPHFHGARGPLVFMALVLLACAVVFIYSEEATAPTIEISERPQDTAYQEEAYKNRAMSIETYIQMNISSLSPVQEVLGGTFYVTEVKASNGSGVVQYEDGHQAYTADFTYTHTDQRGYAVTKFRVRER